MLRDNLQVVQKLREMTASRVERKQNELQKSRIMVCGLVVAAGLSVVYVSTNSPVVGIVKDAVLFSVCSFGVTVYEGEPKRICGLASFISLYLLLNSVLGEIRVKIVLLVVESPGSFCKTIDIYKGSMDDLVGQATREEVPGGVRYGEHISVVGDVVSANADQIIIVNVGEVEYSCEVDGKVVNIPEHDHVVVDLK